MPTTTMTQEQWEELQHMTFDGVQVSHFQQSLQQMREDLGLVRGVFNAWHQRRPRGIDEALQRAINLNCGLLRLVDDMRKSAHKEQEAQKRQGERQSYLRIVGKAA